MGMPNCLASACRRQICAVGFEIDPREILRVFEFRFFVDFLKIFAWFLFQP
jgi:hypothetical protein